MSNRTGPQNPQMIELIAELKRKSIDESSSFWKRIATDLERPTRGRRAVNLSRINRFTKDNELVIVPGKVLGSGVIDHKVTVAAFSFSEGAIVKLKKQNCDALSIAELVQKKPKTSDIRILG
jgi:large subunit ribosomal protein L18e